MRSSTLYILFLLMHMVLPARGQLFINEVMAVNTSGAYNPAIQGPGDWIEIYNGTGYMVELGGYSLSDDPDDPFKWQFPYETYVSPGRYHLVWADGSNLTQYGSHTNFKLGVEGETLFLTNRSGELCDSMSYPAMFENISYGFSLDGSALYFKDPSPGAANNNGSGFLYAGNVAFDPPPAVYSAPREVHITSDSPGGTMRYTLDGSTPGPDDSIYTGPLVLAENTVIRARLFLEGFEPGAISTATYIFSEGFTLPVVSISTDPLNFFDDQTGIYVEGTHGVPGYCMDIPVNWNMDWERPLSFEYFDLAGERRLQFDGGTKIHGGCSRTAPMKPLAIFARSRYGSTSINYPFFTQKDVDSFKGLILRNSGNDNQYTYFRDGAIQATVGPVMNVDVQAFEPVQVFLNGEYWGIHNLREKVNEHWVESNYGIPVGNLDFIKNRGEVFTGTREGWDQLNFFLQNNSLESDLNFRQLADWIDLDAYTDYLLTQLFFANRDWPGNNQKFWRDRVNGGKWRWILFDLDFTMGIYDFNPALDMFTFATAPDEEEWPNPAWSTLLFRRLLENKSYRNQFIQKYLVHLNTTFQPERVTSVIDSFYYRIYEVFPAHVERWGRPWGGIDEWHARVEEIKQFATERPDFVRENMSKFFSLEEELELSVEQADQHGRIHMNQVLLPRTGLKGGYPAGMDLDLDFLASPGYTFDYWEVVIQDSTQLLKSDTLILEDAQISLKLSKDTYIIARSKAAEPDPDMYLYINEFMASNQGAYLDEFGKSPDWLEIYNAGDKEVDLAGFYLTDDLENPAKWRIPQDYPEYTTLGAREHLIFLADGDTALGPLHLNFKLSAQGESIGLSTKSGDSCLWLDSLRFGAQESNTSFGRFPDGEDNWVAMTPHTPRDINQVDHTQVETEILAQWKVFPNPVSDWLNVSMEIGGHRSPDPVILSLRDLTGRQVLEQPVQLWHGQNYQRLDLTFLPAGVYVLTLELDSGVLSKKIIKSTH